MSRQEPKHLISDKYLQSNTTSEVRTLYRQAETWRESRMLDCHGGDPDEQLKYIAGEIRIRVKITQQEIYFIGEMLVQARAILQANNLSFQDWVEPNCGFSYYTANNFCNVYTACAGRLQMINHVKPSVLYQISAPQFPENLRDLLVDGGIAEDLKVKDVKAIYDEYNTIGYENLKLKLEDKANKSLITNHVAPFCDNLRKTKFYMDSVIEKLSVDPVYKTPLSGIKGATVIGDEITTLIMKSLDQCSKILSDAESEVHKIFEGNAHTPTPTITPINALIDNLARATPTETKDNQAVIELKPDEEPGE